MTKLRCLALLGVVAASLAGGTAGAASVADPLDRPALTLRDPAKAAYLALTQAGSRLIAVGERGAIALSDDGGQTWRQARVPVSVTLTAVSFPSPSQGWAVGHAGVVLHTADGGATWQRQLDGITAARIAAASHANDTGLRQHLDQLLADGADKPFLAVHFDDAQHGFVVGAYGLIFATEDGGQTWNSWLDRVDNPRGLHFNAIARQGDSLYIAGEQGLLLRAEASGQRFKPLASPYAGSFFALAANPQRLVVAGLKGHIYASNDQGKSFQPLTNPLPASIVQGGRLGDGRLLFIDQAGHLLLAMDSELNALPLPAGPAALAAVAIDADTWVTASQRGLQRRSSQSKP